MELINNIYKQRFLHKNKKVRFKRFRNRLYDKIHYLKIFRNYSLENNLNFEIYTYNRYDEIDYRSLNNECKLHNDKDVVSLITKDSIQYYKNGKHHRDNNINGNSQAAIIYSNGKKRYFKNGVEFFPDKK